MQHSVLLTWETVLTVKDKGEKKNLKKRKSIRVDRSTGLKIIVMAIKICGKSFQPEDILRKVLISNNLFLKV